MGDWIWTYAGLALGMAIGVYAIWVYPAEVEAKRKAGKVRSISVDLVRWVRLSGVLVLVLVGVLAVALTACTHARPGAGPADTAQVYATLLRDVVLAEGWGGPVAEREQRNPVRQLVLQAETATEAPREIGAFERDGLPMLSPTTIDDYERRYELGLQDARLEGVGEYHWVPRDSMFSLANGRGWREFYRKYPGAPGFVAFSRAGFGEGGDQALVYMELGRGGTWGDGALYVLERTGDRWEIVGKNSLWQA